MFKLRLLPQDKKFFELFNQISQVMISIAKEFDQLLRNFGERDTYLANIRELQIRGNYLAEELKKELFINFVTPLDREDIHALNKVLCSIIDHVHGASIRFDLFDVHHMREDAMQLSDVLLRSVHELEKLIRHLDDLSTLDRITPVVDKLHHLEEEGDLIYRDAIRTLFRNEANDVLRVLKWKDIYERVENAIDKCDNAAGIIMGIVLKYA